MDNEFNNDPIKGNGNETGKSNGIAVTGMVLGIISIVLCWVPVLGLGLAIAGLILGVKGLKSSSNLNGKGKGMGIAGISCGAVGTVFSVMYLIVWIFAVLVAKEVYDEVDNQLDVYRSTYNSYNSSYNRSIYDYDF